MARLAEILLIYGQIFGTIASAISNEDFPVHRHLTKRDLHDIFNVDKHSQVNDYDVWEITEESPRSKRDANDDDDNNQEAIRGKLLTMRSKTTKYVVLIKPNVNLIHEDLIEYKHVVRCVYEGVVLVSPAGSHGQEDGQGHAALSNCDGQGYRGVIVLPHETLNVAPVPDYVANKVSEYRTRPPQMFHFVYATNVRPISMDKLNHYDEAIRSKRQTSTTNLILEMNVVVDQQFKGGRSNDATFQNVVQILNSVQALFIDSSFGRRMYLVLRRYRILPASSPISNVGSLEDYIERFRQSQRSLSNIDVSVALTGQNLSGRTIGIAYLGTVCRPATRVSVVENTIPSLTHKVLAHEIGHNIGIGHDCDSGCCAGGSIMSAILNTGNVGWTSCARNDFQRILDQNRGSCLVNFPTIRINPSLSSIQAGRIPMDALCDFQVARSRAIVSPTMCQTLRCTSGSSSFVSSIRPIDGMRCYQPGSSSVSPVQVCSNSVCTATTVTSQPIIPIPTTTTTAAPPRRCSFGWWWRRRRVICPPSRGKRDIREEVKCSDPEWYTGDWDCSKRRCTRTVLCQSVCGDCACVFASRSKCPGRKPASRKRNRQ